MFTVRAGVAPFRIFATLASHNWAPIPRENISSQKALFRSN